VLKDCYLLDNAQKVLVLTTVRLALENQTTKRLAGVALPVARTKGNGINAVTKKNGQDFDRLGATQWFPDIIIDDECDYATPSSLDKDGNTF
jgi:hypothetical protein